jgi:hypothetical protein
MSLELPTEPREQAVDIVWLPASTAWPIVLAFGTTLVIAGLLTTASVSILGALLAICGCVGWFRDVLPREKHEPVPVLEGAPPVATRHVEVARVQWLAHQLHRARLPLEIYPISAGVKGGLAGSVAMAILALTYGVIGQHSIWYPINLLAAGFVPGLARSTAQLTEFNWSLFIIATVIHLTTSLLVGLLYGAMLPMFPRRPILFGGVIAPVLWSALIYSFIEFLNPLFARRINWLWFVISQLGFGIVAGIVVSRQEQIATWQHLPFAIRAGFETPGPLDQGDGEDLRR